MEKSGGQAGNQNAGKHGFYSRTLKETVGECGIGISPLTLYTVCMEVMMRTLTINFSDDRLAKLKEISRQFGISPEDLIRISVDDLLTRPHEDCSQAIDYVINKNKELYRRLA